MVQTARGTTTVTDTVDFIGNREAYTRSATDPDAPSGGGFSTPPTGSPASQVWVYDRSLLTGDGFTWVTSRMLSGDTFPTGSNWSDPVIFGGQARFEVVLFQRRTARPNAPTGTYTPGLIRSADTYTGSDLWRTDATTGTVQLWQARAIYDPAESSAALSWAISEAGGTGPQGDTGLRGPSGQRIYVDTIYFINAQETAPADPDLSAVRYDFVADTYGSTIPDGWTTDSQSRVFGSGENVSWQRDIVITEGLTTGTPPTPNNVGTAARRGTITSFQGFDQTIQSTNFGAGTITSNVRFFSGDSIRSTSTLASFNHDIRSQPGGTPLSAAEGTTLLTDATGFYIGFGPAASFDNVSELIGIADPTRTGAGDPIDVDYRFQLLGGGSRFQFLSTEAIPFGTDDIWFRIGRIEEAVPPTGFTGNLSGLFAASSGSAIDIFRLERESVGWQLDFDGNASLNNVDIRGDSTIEGDVIVSGTITSDEIADNTITANEIAPNTITAEEIAANAITAEEIAANAITASELASNSVTADQIASGAITAREIAAGTITADQIAQGAASVQLTGASTATVSSGDGRVTVNVNLAGRVGTISNDYIVLVQIRSRLRNMVTRQVLFGSAANRLVTSARAGSVDQIRDYHLVNQRVERDDLISNGRAVSGAIVVEPSVTQTLTLQAELVTEAVGWSDPNGTIELNYSIAVLVR